MSGDKPKVLVLGGTGFIGRHLVQYIIDNELASLVRVVDKTPPQMAWLNETHRRIFANENVQFYSANLINEGSCKNAFSMAPSQDTATTTTTTVPIDWDIVFNCAAETRPGQSEPVYNEGITKLSLNCIRASIEHNCKRFIEFSSGNMMSSEKQPIKEDISSNRDPWTFVAKRKAQIEDELNTTYQQLLSYTILRLPLVYGIGDRKGLTSRIIIAGLYKYLNEPMKLLWNETMKLNTVHVTDVAAAAWHLANLKEAKSGTYNIVDDSKSSQGTISSILKDLFEIEIDYWGITMSSITKINMNEAVDEINDKHLNPWAIVCRNDDIENTPLTPYMDSESLLHKHLNLDNGKLKETGFQLCHPMLNVDLIKEIVNDFIKEKLYPPTIGF